MDKIEKEELKVVSGGGSGSTSSCPACGCSSIIRETRTTPQGKLVTYRICILCDYEWDFTETESW